MKIKRYTAVLILFFISTSMFAQIDMKNICKISDNRITFLLDLKWTAEEKLAVSDNFDLDSALIEMAFNMQNEFEYDSITWRVKKINNRIIELSKEGNFTAVENITYDEKLIRKMLLEELFKRHEKEYGINDFKEERIFKYEKGRAVFFLPGFLNAQKVYLSGSFNNWSTLQNPMQFVDSGWVAPITLKPGKYMYKYIVDGNWIIDPNNEQKQQNEHGTFNSVVFCTNHVFKLKKQHKREKKVFLAGSFNNWNPKELRMIEGEDRWYLPIWLKEGTHTYKFVVNKKWLIDSLNPLVREDGKGNFNSVLELGEKHRFYTDSFQNVNKLILTGSFNNWDEYELSMNKTDSGWYYDYTLAPGVYEYKFIADGNWHIDNNNPYTIGQGVYTNSVLIFQANYTFELVGYETANNVSVTGLFNDWNPIGYPMQKEDGKWTFPAYLEKGKQLYKFIVDGEWILDPANPLYEDNQYGTYNSVLWID
jgi:hypothetical protein